MSAPGPPPPMPLWKHVVAWLIPFTVAALAWALFGPGGFLVGLVVGIVPYSLALWLLGDRF